METSDWTKTQQNVFGSTTFLTSLQGFVVEFSVNYEYIFGLLSGKF